jgi:hypothetical protein
MKIRKNEDQSVDTLPLLRIGNKTPLEGVTETKFGAEIKGWTMCHLESVQETNRDLRERDYDKVICIIIIIINNFSYNII